MFGPLNPRAVPPIEFARRLVSRRPALISTYDPYWANVKSLLNMGGTDGSTVFSDETGRPWEAFGGAQIDTSLGYNSGQFDGAGAYINTPHTGDLVLRADDFCVEGFTRVSNTSNQQTIIEKRGTSFASGDWAIFIYANEVIIYAYDVNSAGNVILASGSGSIATNMEFHWAWTRSGSTMRLFIDGVQMATATTSVTIAFAPTPLSIARDNVDGGRFWLNGHIRAIRITVGFSRYAANFTVPTAPFPTA